MGKKSLKKSSKIESSEEENEQTPNELYNVENITRFGRPHIPTFIMGENKTKKVKIIIPTPGPGQYYPENYEKLGLRTPAFTLKGRYENIKENTELPSPNQYQHDICVTKPCTSRITRPFGSRWKEPKIDQAIPFYSVVDLNTYKRKYPTYKIAPPSFSSRYIRTQENNSNRFLNKSTVMPKVMSDHLNYYYPKYKNAPAYSFGQRWSNYANTIRTSNEFQQGNNNCHY